MQVLDPEIPWTEYKESFMEIPHCILGMDKLGYLGVHKCERLAYKYAEIFSIFITIIILYILYIYKKSFLKNII